MSEAAPLDPKRPWITDPRELLENQNWLGTYFNPLGRTPRVHFRRAWLVLVLLAIPTIALLQIFAAGAMQGRINSGVGFGAVILLVMTTVGTYSLHVRRANDAGKSPLWALLVLLPALVALLLLPVMNQAAEQQFRRIDAMIRYSQDPEALKAEDPAAYKLAEEQIKAQEEARKKAEADAEAGGRRVRVSEQAGAQRRGGRRGGRGRRGGPGGGPDSGPPTQLALLSGMMMGTAGMFWAVSSFFLMLWSLLAAGRWPSRD